MVFTVFKQELFTFVAYLPIAVLLELWYMLSKQNNLKYFCHRCGGFMFTMDLFLWINPCYNAPFNHWW